jgi:hypothetical protein
MNRENLCSEEISKLDFKNSESTSNSSVINLKMFGGDLIGAIEEEEAQEEETVKACKNKKQIYKGFCDSV